MKRQELFYSALPILLWTPPELSVAGFTLFFMATDLRTALRMYEAGARAILDVDWSVEIDDELLDGVRRMDRVERQAPGRAQRRPGRGEVRGVGGAARLPHGGGVPAAAAELLRGGGGVAAVAGR